MTDRVVRVLEEIADFTPEERRQVFDHLWHVVECDEGAAEMWDDPEFRAEIERHMDEVENHPELLIDGPTAMAELRARFREGKTVSRDETAGSS
jgi:hypothetical protein